MPIRRANARTSRLVAVGSIEGGFRHDARTNVDSFSSWGRNSIEIHLRWAGRLAAARLVRRTGRGEVY